MSLVESKRKPRLFGRGIVVTSLALLFFLAGPTAAEARAPVPDGGRIDIGPGWRFEPLRGSSSFGGMARFSWQIDRRWFLGIEIGGWGGNVDVDRLGLDQPASVERLTLWVGDLRFALGAHLLRVGPAWFYAVGGGGYHILGVQVGDRYYEGATQGLFAGAGTYVPFGERFGFLLENRFTLLARQRAAVGGEEPLLDAGGNLLWGGLVIFFEPEPRPGGSLRHERTRHD